PSVAGDAAGAYPTTSPTADPYSHYPTAIGGAIGSPQTPMGIAVQGVAPAYGAAVPQSAGLPAGPVPASVQTAAPCCAPSPAGYTSGSGQDQPFMVFGKPNVPCTIGKPTYQARGHSLSEFSVGRVGSAAPAASTPALAVAKA